MPIPVSFSHFQVQRMENLVQDKLDKLEIYGSLGSNELFKIMEYLKKRISIEDDYHRNLQRLNRQADYSGIELLKPIIQCFEERGQAHAELAKILGSAIQEQIRSIIRTHDKEREAMMARIKNLRQEWKTLCQMLEKNRKAKETATRSAEEARTIFGKLENDPHATKAQVEKAREECTSKYRKMMQAKQEYRSVALESVRRQRSEIFMVKIPQCFDTLKQAEIMRLKETCEVTRAILQLISKIDQELISRTTRVATMDMSEEIQQLNSEYAIENGIELPELEDDHLEKPKDRLADLTESMKILSKQRDGLAILFDLYSKQPDLADEQTRKQTTSEYNDLCKLIECMELDRKKLQKEISTNTKSSPVVWDDEDGGSSGIVKARAIYSYVARDGTEEVSFQAGDVVTVHSKAGDWWEIGTGNQERGYAPFNYLSVIE